MSVVQTARSYLTADEAAAFLGVSRATLYAYVSRGQLDSEPGGAGRAHRYPRRSLEELKAKRDKRREPARGALAGGVPVLESALTLIEGGCLFYRGQEARELSRTATLEEVAALLWTASSEEAEGLFPARSRRRRASAVGSIGDRLVAALVAERAAEPFTLAPAGPATRKAAARTISALFDAAGATGAGRLAERLARGWGTERVTDLEAALILCADHELNTSAFTARCVASTDAPIANVLLAALCALEGRRHGGTSREIERLLVDAERFGAEMAVERALTVDGRLPGLDGHHLYRDGDPRALELLSRLDLADDEPAAQLMRLAARNGGSPTIELALTAFARHARLPAGGAFAIFALGRSIGWVAHAFEAAETGRLFRPRARYVGPLP
jgi:citrate synthase